MDEEFRKPAYSEIQVEVFLSELTSADRIELTTPLNIFAEDVKGQVRNYQEARHIAVSYLLI
jgi:ribosome recycling factor